MLPSYAKYMLSYHILRISADYVVNAFISYKAMLIILSMFSYLKKLCWLYCQCSLILPRFALYVMILYHILYYQSMNQSMLSYLTKICWICYHIILYYMLPINQSMLSYLTIYAIYAENTANTIIYYQTKWIVLTMPSDLKKPCWLYCQCSIVLPSYALYIIVLYPILSCQSMMIILSILSYFTILTQLCWICYDIISYKYMLIILSMFSYLTNMLIILSMFFDGSKLCWLYCQCSHILLNYADYIVNTLIYY